MSDFQHKNDSNLFDISKISENFNVASESLKNVSQNYVPDTDIEEVILDESPTIKIPHNDWIFGEKSEKTGQFGGDQGSLKNNSEKYINDPIVRDIVNKYYPDATKEDLELLFEKMCSVGCGYIALVNTIMLEGIFHSETEFYEKFGFYPYDLVYDENHRLYKDFNYEYLFLDFFLYSAKEQKFKSIEDVYGNIAEELENTGGGDSALNDQFESTGMKGAGDFHSKFTNEQNWISDFKKYLKDKKIDVEVLETRDIKKIDKSKDPEMWEKKKRELFDSLKKMGGYKDLKYEDFTDELVEKDGWLIDYDKIPFDIFKKYMNEGTMRVSSHDFPLYYPYDKDGNGKFDDVCYSNVGGHAMTVVGTTSDGDLVVSSWGNKYIMRYDDIIDIEFIQFNK